MKKILVFTLLFVYTSLACGLNIKLHYCGGKIKSISLFSKTDEGGCCGSKMKTKSCCKDKIKYLKVKDKHNSNFSLQIIPLKDNVSQENFNGTLICIDYSDQTTFIKDYYPPPVLYDNPLFLKHKALII